jgi:hypothetical protein
MIFWWSKTRASVRSYNVTKNEIFGPHLQWTKNLAAKMRSWDNFWAAMSGAGA